MAISRKAKNLGIDREPVTLTVAAATMVQDEPILIADSAAGGAANISQALRQVAVTNWHATTACRVAPTLAGLVGTDYVSVPGATAPGAGSRLLPATWSQVWLLADGAAGGPIDVQAEGMPYGLPNDELGAPGYGTWGFNLNNAGNETITRTWTPQYDVTITAINVYSLAQPASTSGTFLLDGTANGSTLFAQYDLEGITADTVTAMTLTATAAQLAVKAGQSIVLTSTSNNADLDPGKVQVSISYTEG